MLGVQNSLPVSHPVKFKGNDDYLEGETPRYIPEPYEDDSYVNSEFNPDEINAERDRKMAEYERTQADMNKFADSLDKNPDKLSKGLGKVVRFGAGLIGLAGTFVLAKYGAKVSIGTMKGLAKSNVAKDIINVGKSAFEPIGKGLKSAKATLNKFVGNSIVETFKKSKLGQKAEKFMAQENVKNFVDKAKGYKEAVKVLAKSVNGEKVQNVAENTLAASATASVAIDNLAGRNKDKSNLDLALGVSGGNK